MPDVLFDPLLPVGPTQGFIQSIRLTEGGQSIGQSRWYVTGDGSTGVAQLLELSTSPTHRRTGQGKQLLEVTIDQIRQFFNARRIQPRRVWMNIQQKDQVIGRAFLTEHGFHHVATIPAMLKGQDSLIYVLAMD